MRIAINVLSFVILFFQSLAFGASFDCSKASTNVEKTICASKTLSELDEQLASAYKSTVSMSTNPDKVISQQWDWLRNVRNKCKDENCLKNAYKDRLAQLEANRQTEWSKFSDTNLGIEFFYPTNRKVKAGCRESRNCIALVGKPMTYSDYIIAFEVFDGSLEMVAVEQAVFEKRARGWVALGRQGEHPAASIEGHGWKGLKAIVDCGILDSSGFHSSAGECLWVVLSNGKRSVVVDTQGIVGNDEDSMRSIQSIHFIK